MTDPAGREEGVALRGLVALIWARRWLCLSIVVLGVALGGASALLSKKKYEASVLLSPVSDGMASGGGLGAAASQLSSVAMLAGISIPNDSRKAEAVAILQSDVLAQEFINRNNLLPVIFADRWDTGKGIWKVDKPAKVPTLWAASRLFDRIRSVSTDPRSGLVTLTINWSDPAQAAAWANGLVALTDEYLRTRAIEETSKNIQYLNEEVAKTGSVEVRRAVYSLLENEIYKEMLAKGAVNYALNVLDPAKPPEQQFSPRLTVWMLVGFLLGALVAFLLSLFLEARPAGLPMGK